MTRLAVAASIAACLLAAGLLLVGCGSGRHRVQASSSTTSTSHYTPVVRAGVGSGYSVAAVRAAFSAQGVDLVPFQSSGGNPTGARWVYLIGKQPHRIHVNVQLGPYRGRYQHLTYGLSAVGSDRAEYRNVLLAWTPDDQAVVMGALRRLK